MNMPFDKATLNQAQKDVVRVNGLEEGYLRPMCFYGSEGMGLRADNLQTHVMVAAWDWPSYMDPEARDRGIKVRTSSFTRHHVNISMCKAKANGNYINSMLALREALESGAEEALLLDNEGYVAEGSGENVFVIHDDTIFTPELTSCLDGITRDVDLCAGGGAGLYRCAKSASPGMKSMSPTRPSSPEPPPRWCRSARWMDALSAAAAAVP